MAVSDSEYKKMLASGESAGNQSTNNPIYKDQYQPMPAPLFVEETPEQGTVVGNWEPSEFDIYGIQPLEIMEGESFEQMEARLKGVQL